MARRKKHRRGKGRVVVSKSGRRYRKSPGSRKGWTLIPGGKKRRTKKRRVKKSRRRKHTTRRRHTKRRSRRSRLY